MTLSSFQAASLAGVADDFPTNGDGQVWRLMLASQVGGGAASSALSAAAQIAELRKQKSKVQADARMEESVCERQRIRLAAREAQREKAMLRAEEVLKAQAAVRTAGRQHATENTLRQVHTAMIQTKDQEAAKLRGRVRERNQMLAQKLARDAQDKLDLWLLNVFVTWKLQVEVQRCSGLKGDVDSFQEQLRRKDATKLSNMETLLCKLTAGRHAVEIKVYWLQWCDAVFQTRKSHAAHHHRLTQLHVVTAMAERCNKETSFSLMRECLVSWSCHVRQGSIAVPAEAIVAAPSAQEVVLERRNKALDVVLASVLAQQLQLCLLGAFASWRVAVRLLSEEHVEVALHAGHSKALELKSNFATSKCLAGLIAAALEVTVAGAFACWRVAWRMRRAEMTQSSKLEVETRHWQANAILARRSSAACKLMSRHVINQLALFLAGVLLSWYCVVQKKASLHAVSRWGVVARLLAEKQMRWVLVGTCASLRLHAVELQPCTKSEIEILTRRSRAACKLVSKHMVDRLEVFLGGVLLSWHSIANAMKKRALVPQQETTETGKADSAPSPQHRRAVLGHRHQHLSGMVARLLAERVEQVALGAFTSWRIATKRHHAAFTHYDDERMMSLSMLTRRNVSACLLLSRYIADRLQFFLIGVLLSWRSVAHHGSKTALLAQQSRGSYRLVAHLLAEKLEALVLGTFTSWRHAAAKEVQHWSLQENALLTRRSGAACKLVSRHLVEKLELLLIGVVLSWRFAVQPPDDHSRGRRCPGASRRIVARLLAEKLEALVLGTFTSWRHAARWES
mmetsp:Transcript_41322/g.74719  ORF Transcript_41322/g.74719 Transcript_41322/m.74719 type:complete len:796 (-) Transcript_41322:48-2435(-)